ncbi:MAG: lipase family protein, partial [Candidatus Igneacidithiobacillus chanchocoensis]
MGGDEQITSLARIAGQVYNDPPQFGAADGPARARLYGDVMAFRGTDDIEAWLFDLDALVVLTPLGHSHNGFWGAYKTIQAQIETMTPSTIVGHSLGGALALIYVGRLCQLGKPPDAVYCFEPPRVCGDGVLKKILSDNGVMCWACRNGLDPVPEVPTYLQL